MSFFGGGTDMPTFFQEYGGAVISTTFDKYCYITVRHLPPFFDYTTELLEKALMMAGNEWQILNTERLSCSMYYEGCHSSYFKAYDENDTARLAELSRRYDLMIERLKNNNYDLNEFTWVKLTIVENIEDAAWLYWVGFRDNLPMGATQRPAPGKYN